MANFTKDMELLTAAVTGSAIGSFTLQNITTFTPSDVDPKIELSDRSPVDGSRATMRYKDTSKTFEIAVQTGSFTESQLRRLLRFPKVPFSFSWTDARSIDNIEKGSGSQCFITRDSNSRLDDSTTFTIISANYNGD